MGVFGLPLVGVSVSSHIWFPLDVGPCSEFSLPVGYAAGGPGEQRQRLGHVGVGIRQRLAGVGQGGPGTGALEQTRRQPRLKLADIDRPALSVAARSTRPTCRPARPGRAVGAPARSRRRPSSGTTGRSAIKCGDSPGRRWPSQSRRETSARSSRSTSHGTTSYARCRNASSAGERGEARGGQGEDGGGDGIRAGVGRGRATGCLSEVAGPPADRATSDRPDGETLAASMRSRTACPAAG